MPEHSKPWLSHYDAAVAPTLAYPEAPLYALLDEAARRWPDRTALIYPGVRLSYAQLGTLTDAWAAALAGLGLQPGDHVALLLPNWPQFVIGFYGALKAGLVAVPLNPAYKERELAFYLALTGARCLLAQTAALPMLQNVLLQTQVTHLIVTAPDDALTLARWPSLPTAAPLPAAGPLPFLDLLNWVAGAHRPPVAASADSPALLAATGGTTGAPKVALGTHRSLVANTVQFRQWAAPWAEGREVMAVALPLFHLFGLIVSMSVGVMIGATLLLIPDSRDTGALAAALAEHEATLLPAVPAIFQALNRQATAAELRSLRWAISGAAALPMAVKAAFEALTEARLVEGYGLTEAMVVTHCNPLQGESRPASIGLPLPGVEARIVSLDDTATLARLPAGALGELVVRGPALMTGYFARPEETALALRGGWLHTGDVARMDADGYFYVVDRQKDVIKVGGLQVWPREVEEVLAALPQVAEAAAAGVPHPEYGEMVKAWVVLKPGQTLSAEEVRAWCQQRLAAYKAPREVVFVARLPRSAAGKVLRRELRR